MKVTRLCIQQSAMLNYTQSHTHIEIYFNLHAALIHRLQLFFNNLFHFILIVVPFSVLHTFSIHKHTQQKSIEINNIHGATKLLSCDNVLNSHQQLTMSPNYQHSSGNHNMDYRNGSFYDNHQQQQQQQSYHCTDDDESLLHRQHYFFTTTTNDRHSTIMTITTTTSAAVAAAAAVPTTSSCTRATDSMYHSSSDASSKSERQMPTNHYHQQNGGFRMQSKNQPANNNECEMNMMAAMDDSHVLMHQRSANAKQTISQYGKIINSNKLMQMSGGGGKDHRNGTRPIPMLPSPPSTPPPPLNAKIKDYHDSSNKFYQDFQSSLHLSNQQQNRFNGNINNINNNNNNNNMISTNEVKRKGLEYFFSAQF